MAQPPANLAVGQAVIIERLDNLKHDVNEKHKQNRNDIHRQNGRLEQIDNEIWLLKVKVAGYAGLGSTAATLIFEGIKYWASHK